ncbi:hypothetical protein IKE67_04705 [bacterium]|nr:hypothetical protein [bacterium]
MQQELLHLTYNEFNELESFEFELPQDTVIEGIFEQEDDVKSMAIRKLNFTLCILLAILIAITTVSYYFATATEITLNNLSRETSVFNDENVELENQLDKLKSFNNVDESMQKSNLLSKAKKVIEVEEVNSANVAKNTLDSRKVFSWSIGY